MGVGAQGKEVHKIVQVDLPIPLGIGIERQVHARQLAGQALAVRIHGFAVFVLVEHFGIVGVAAFGVVAQQRQHTFRLLALQNLAPALAVGARLGAQLVGRRDIIFLVQDGIARRIFIDVGGAVTDPLARHEDGQLDVVLDLAHFEGRRVAVAHEVVDQPGVVAGLARALAVRNAGRLDHRRVVAHVIDDADEAVVEDGDRLEKDFLKGRHRGAPGLVAIHPLGLDLGPLLGA